MVVPLLLLVRGDVSNGINDTALNSECTLSIKYTKGKIYTTPFIHGAVDTAP